MNFELLTGPFSGPGPKDADARRDARFQQFGDRSGAFLGRRDARFQQQVPPAFDDGSDARPHYQNRAAPESPPWVDAALLPEHLTNSPGWLAEHGGQAAKL